MELSINGDEYRFQPCNLVYTTGIMSHPTSFLRKLSEYVVSGVTVEPHPSKYNPSVVLGANSSTQSDISEPGKPLGWRSGDVRPVWRDCLPADESHLRSRRDSVLLLERPIHSPIQFIANFPV